MKNSFLITATVLVFGLWMAVSMPSYAETGHAHAENHETHDDSEGHAHDDGDEHADHNEAEDQHDEHGHGEHGKEDAHDEHGHGDEEGGHEEGKVDILQKSAEQAGIEVETVQPKNIAETVSLTGRMVVNENKKMSVRGRFPGLVRSVQVNLGDVVKKGQVLAVIESNDSLQRYQVTSPISGTVLERNTNVGDVAGDNVLFTVVDLSTLWAKFHVFSKDIEKIKGQQKVRIHALGQSEKEDYTIDMLFPTADAQSQTLIAIAEVNNETGAWRSGMAIEGDVIISETAVDKAVKVSALQKMEENTVVFIKDKDSYTARPIQLGKTDGIHIEVLEGLEHGETYVSNGSFVVKADILKSGAAHEH